MESRDSPHVLLLCHDAARARAWATALAEAGLRTQTQNGEHAYAPSSDANAPGDARVMISDRPLLGCGEHGVDGIGSREFGLIAVGWEGEADVVLPDDASMRELTLACRLLCDNVQLGRRLQAERKKCRRLTKLAQTDPITGLPNRRVWDRELVRRWAARENDAALGVVIFDLDHFKGVNDEHGHPQGDAVLRAAGAALREASARDDFTARLGGDEFGLLFEGAGSAGENAVSEMVDRLRKAVAERLAKEQLPVVTVSAGCRVVSDPASSAPRSAEAAADGALREAKRRGRNQTVVAGVN